MSHMVKHDGWEFLSPIPLLPQPVALPCYPGSRADQSPGELSGCLQALTQGELNKNLGYQNDFGSKKPVVQTYA